MPPQSGDRNIELDSALNNSESNIVVRDVEVVAAKSATGPDEWKHKLDVCRHLLSVMPVIDKNKVDFTVHVLEHFGSS